MTSTGINKRTVAMRLFHEFIVGLPNNQNPSRRLNRSPKYRKASVIVAARKKTKAKQTTWIKKTTAISFRRLNDVAAVPAAGRRPFFLACAFNHPRYKL